jgi:hypothetical protein
MFRYNDFIVFISSYDAKMKTSKYFHFAFSLALYKSKKKKNKKHQQKTKRDIKKTLLSFVMIDVLSNIYQKF